MPTLALSNKHLATSALRKQAVRVTVATSSAIEGIRFPFKQSKPVVKAKPASPKSGSAGFKRASAAKSVE